MSEVQPTIVNVPYYVDSKVLKAGAVVYAVADTEHTTPLVVLYVEPAVVCRKPDGDQIFILAHELESES